MMWTTLGIVLHYYREKYDFSQAEICRGICSVATLSRVEAGEREIDSLTGELLLGRIGKEITQFELMLNEDDYGMWILREEICKAVQKKDYENAKQRIWQYRTQLTADQKLHHQFCEYYEVKIAIALQEKEEKICALAYEALKRTKPQFDISNRERQLYTPFEVELILILIQNGNFKAAEQPIDRLEVLLSYVETYYTGQKREKLSIEILLELVRQNERNESCGDAIKYVDKALLFLSESRSMEHVAELHYRKAMAVRKKYGKAAEWDEVCKRECKLAYFAARMGKDDELTDKVLRYCKETLEWQITEQEILFV